MDLDNTDMMLLAILGVVCVIGAVILYRKYSTKNSVPTPSVPSSPPPLPPISCDLKDIACVRKLLDDEILFCKFPQGDREIAQLVYEFSRGDPGMATTPPPTPLFKQFQDYYITLPQPERFLLFYLCMFLSDRQQNPLMAGCMSIPMNQRVFGLHTTQIKTKLLSISPDIFQLFQ